MRRWHSVAEVAQMLGLAPMTVYRAIHDGRLPAMKIGRRYLIPARALDAMEKAAAQGQAVAIGGVDQGDRTGKGTGP